MAWTCEDCQYDNEDNAADTSICVVCEAKKSVCSSSPSSFFSSSSLTSAAGTLAAGSVLPSFGIKRSRDEEHGDNGSERRPPPSTREPLCFFTQNVNGLSKLLNSFPQQFSDLVADVKPDVLSFSEVWVIGNPVAPGQPLGDSKDAKALAPLPHFGQRYWSLNTSARKGGLLVALRDGVERPSFVSSSLSAAASTADLRGYAPSSPLTSLAHTHGGRVLVLGYPSFLFVSLYMPNIGDGSDLAKLQFRRYMDDDLKAFARAAREAGKPLLVVGDLNVSPAELDVSHPFSWPDKFKAGNTAEERGRFGELLAAGGLVDLWREHHPAPPLADKAYLEGHNFTWRGAGMNRNYAMRIDHALCSQDFADRVLSVDILGDHRRETFMGSDHCPLVVKLRPNGEVAPPSPSFSSSPSSSTYSDSE